MLELFTDVLVGVNIVLIFGSAFLALEIIRCLGMKDNYVLAKGWKYILPAVLVIAVLHVYNFFADYSVYNPSRLVQELMYLVFNICLFSGLLVQFLAIKKVLEERS